MKEDNIILLDNTKISKPNQVNKIKLTTELLLKLKEIKLLKLSKKNLGRIYSTNKAKYYKNLLNFYNYNSFGYGISGNQTRFDPTTLEGLVAIQANFDYAKRNATDFLTNVAGAGLAVGINAASNKALLLYNRLNKGVFRVPSKNGILGTLKLYSKNPIDEGAEAIVVNNTPTTVGKMTSIPVEEMAVRNLIPNTVSSKYIGYVKDRGTKLPTYILKKVKVLTEETFPKYANKLDKAMERSGFRRVNDPNILYRAYTNGLVVVDDIAPGNVGLTSGNSYLDIILPNFLKKPQIIDMAYLTVPEWTALGFTLKRGGKL